MHTTLALVATLLLGTSTERALSVRSAQNWPWAPGDTLWVVGKIEKLATCPPCPPGKDCPPCRDRSVVLADHLGQASGGPLTLRFAPPEGLVPGQLVQVAGKVTGVEAGVISLDVVRVVDDSSDRILTPLPPLPPFPLPGTTTIGDVVAKAASLKQKAVKVSGAAIELFTCPSCPPRAECKPCPGDRLTLSSGGSSIVVCRLPRPSPELFGTAVALEGTLTDGSACSAGGSLVLTFTRYLPR